MLNKINEDLKTAIKQGDKISKSVLRYLKSEIHNREISIGSSLTDEQIIDVLNKQAKQRRESIEAFKNGNRIDLVQREEKELSIIMSYLPNQLSETEIENIVKEGIIETKATSSKDIGKVMSWVMPKVKGKADGKIISVAVTAILNE
tara:strand:- start:188 stop:628 length:441 start_codon:yes stop_codon:yes gene_type:complete